MKELYASLVFTFLFLSKGLLAQSQVEYTYDQNGNRLNRKLVIVELKSFAVDSTLSVPEILKLEEEVYTEPIEKHIKVFPNPVKSSLTIQISGYDESLHKSAMVFSIKGDRLKYEKRIGSETTLPLERLDDGIYLLRVTIGEEIFQYKIVKSR